MAHQVAAPWHCPQPLIRPGRAARRERCLRANADVVSYLPPNAFAGQIVGGDCILMCDVCNDFTFARLASRCGTCDRMACTGWCESTGAESGCLACDDWASGCQTSVAPLDQLASSASTLSSFERLIASKASIGRRQTLAIGCLIELKRLRLIRHAQRIFHWSGNQLGRDTVEVAQHKKLCSFFTGYCKLLKSHKSQDRTLAQKLWPTMRLEQ